MIYLFIGTVIGIAICAAFCGIIMFSSALNVNDLEQHRLEQRIARHLQMRAIYENSKRS